MSVPTMFRPLVKYATFDGRARRAEFWLFLLLMYLLMGSLVAGFFVTSMSGGRFDLDMALTNYMRWSPIFSVVNLALLIPYFAVAVRRLHDTNRTGWWLALPFIVSVVAYILFFVFNIRQVMEIMMSMAQQMAANPEVAASPVTILKLEWPLFKLMLPWIGIPGGLVQIFMMVLWALPGTPGDNRFGPPPAR